MLVNTAENSFNSNVIKCYVNLEVLYYIIVKFGLKYYKFFVKNLTVEDSRSTLMTFNTDSKRFLQNNIIESN